MAPPGTITLTNPLTGTFQVAYTRRTGSSIPVGSAIDLLPYRRIVEPGERITGISTLEAASEIFEQIAALTGETQWRRAADAALSTIENLDTSQPIYLWRKQPGAPILSTAGVQIHYPATDRFLTVLRMPDGEVSLYVPPQRNGLVELRQTEVVPAVAPSSEISVELSASIPAIAALVLRVGATEWRAAIAVSPVAGNQAIAGQDFVQWTPDTEWHPTDGSIELATQGAGVATWQYQNIALGALHPVALILTLIPNLGAAGAILRGRFGRVPAPIFYSASNAVRLRLQDAAGWFWETVLPTTGGQYQARSLSWSDFLLSASQENGGNLPIAPAQQGPIQRYEVIATQAATTFSIQYVGAAPTRLSEIVLPTEWAIAPQEPAAHTLQIGDVVLASAPAPPYRVTRQELQISPAGRTVRGSSLTWRQRLDDPTVHQFWVDAQDQYQQETGVTGPFFLAYRWGADGAPGFIQQDALYDLEWGGWQAKTGAIACRAWYETGSAVARLAAERWLNFLDDQWGEAGGVILDRFTPLPQRSNQPANSIAAWYAEAALYGNIAGGDRLLTYRLLSKAVDLLLQANFDDSVSPDLAGEGAIAVLHAAGRLLRHQSEIRYPTPSETGDLNSEFAAKTVKIMAFQPPLNLPIRNAYGFRFQIPFKLEGSEPAPITTTADSTSYTIDTTSYTIDATK